MHIERRLEVAEALNATSALLADGTKTDAQVTEALALASTLLATGQAEAQADVDANKPQEDNIGSVDETGAPEVQDAPAS